MRAWRITGPFSIDALQCEEVAPPPPPGPGEVMIRLGAVSLNYRDLLVIRGHYSKKLPLPLTVCSDCAGTVTEVGEGVWPIRPGDLVCPAFMPAWIDGLVDEKKARSALGAFAQGVLTEQVCFHQNSVVRIGRTKNAEAAASLPCAGVTAWNALVTQGHVSEGDTVLIQGSGGVSVMALGIAVGYGAKVVAISSSESKMARLRELGAAHTINYVETPAWEEAVREWTGGRGVDHVVEVCGAPTFNKSVRAVRMGGRISLIGNRAAGAAEVNLTPVLMKHVCVQGIFVGSVEMFKDMENSSAAPPPPPDRVFPFEEAREAFRYFESAAHVGKVVIQVS